MVRFAVADVLLRGPVARTSSKQMLERRKANLAYLRYGGCIVLVLIVVAPAAFLTRTDVRIKLHSSVKALVSFRYPVSVITFGAGGTGRGGRHCIV